MPQPVNNSQHFALNRILIGGLILYVCAFAILLWNKSFDASRRRCRSHRFRNCVSAHRMDHHSAGHSTLDFHNAGQSPINPPDRIHYCLIGLSGQRSAMDRSASSFLVDRFRADQVFYHARKEAYRFRRYSSRDLSIRFRLSASRFRNSERGFTSASRQSFTRCPCCGRRFCCFPIFSQRRRSCLPTWTVYR